MHVYKKALENVTVFINQINNDLSNIGELLEKISFYLNEENYNAFLTGNQQKILKIQTI